ncbi:MAG: methylmalonyl Co-A mutase-associated GTPase MeaB [Spirochaeta sp.]|jgi:LAO/AO transport system kinase|nr:methylmalonyl Co-A mutase-associated GTPase MeaB [Spirochaeta sp.]
MQNADTNRVNPADRLNTLVTDLRAGRRRAVARAISLVEQGAPEREELLRRLGAGAGTARVIGMTGPPGAGKSTLLNGLISAARAAGRRVAVLAVDPSSPFTGGALLGDRVRMTRHSADDGVFIRSMATRGHAGGLSAAALEAVQILSAAGYQDILVESVGVGQSEVGILSLADIVLVVLTPGAGDEIQALKAGVMEIGDIYVINKADYPGVESLERELREVCATALRGAVPPTVRRTVATTGDGVVELYHQIGIHLDALIATGEQARRRRERAGDLLADIAADVVRRWVKQRGAAGSPVEISSTAFRRTLAGALETVAADTAAAAALGTVADDTATADTPAADTPFVTANTAEPDAASQGARRRNTPDEED